MTTPHLVFRHWRPTRIGVEAVDSASNLEGVRAEVLFIHDAILADHEGLDAGYAVLRRGGDEREATDHHPLHYIIEFAEWRRRSLAFEYLEEIAAIGLRSTRVPARNRLGDILADRATPGAIESS